jgi:hypothetical protein
MRSCIAKPRRFGSCAISTITRGSPRSTHQGSHRAARSRRNVTCSSVSCASVRVRTAQTACHSCMRSVAASCRASATSHHRPTRARHSPRTRARTRQRAASALGCHTRTGLAPRNTSPTGRRRTIRPPGAFPFGNGSENPPESARIDGYSARGSSGRKGVSLQAKSGVQHRIRFFLPCRRSWVRVPSAA